jgi:hypothetical protein
MISKYRFYAFASLFFILVDLVLLSVSAWYAHNDLKNPMFDMAVPRFFLVYIAMAFAVSSFSYSSY